MADGLEPGPLSGESLLVAEMHQGQDLLAPVLGHSAVASDMRLEPSAIALRISASAVGVSVSATGAI